MFPTDKSDDRIRPLVTSAAHQSTFHETVRDRAAAPDHPDSGREAEPLPVRWTFGETRTARLCSLN